MINLTFRQMIVPLHHIPYGNTYSDCLVPDLYGRVADRAEKESVRPAFFFLKMLYNA